MSTDGMLTWLEAEEEAGLVVVAGLQPEQEDAPNA